MSFVSLKKSILTQCDGSSAPCKRKRGPGGQGWDGQGEGSSAEAAQEDAVDGRDHGHGKDQSSRSSLVSGEEIHDDFFPSWMIFAKVLDFLQSFFLLFFLGETNLFPGNTTSHQWLIVGKEPGTLYICVSKARNIKILMARILMVRCKLCQLPRDKAKW